MGSCFDEAYTRFLCAKEKDFKRELGLKIADSRRGSMVSRSSMSLGWPRPREISMSFKKKTCGTMTESPQISVGNHFGKTKIAIQLLQKVSQLTSNLMNMDTSILSYRERTTLIAEIKHLLEEIKTDPAAADELNGKRVSFFNARKEVPANGLKTIVE